MCSANKFITRSLTRAISNPVDILTVRCLTIYERVNEALIRDVVAEVLGRLGQAPASKAAASPAARSSPAPAAPTATPAARSIGRGKFGVFQDANEACAAAQAASSSCRQKGVAARQKVVEIIKALAEANAVEWGRIELEETKIGRLDHKIEKLKIIKLVPGVEWLSPYGRSGDHGITLEEYTPFGVIGAITPSTHSIPTLSGNIVNMVAAGNAVVFNAHPAAAKCAAAAVRAYNQAIMRETGIENLIAASSSSPPWNPSRLSAPTKLCACSASRAARAW